MNRFLAFAAFAAALGLAGCAVPDQKAESAPAPKNDEYVTGSRIPVRSGSSQPVTSVSGDTYRRESSAVIGSSPRGN
jgi:hypothetical protein